MGLTYVLPSYLPPPRTQILEHVYVIVLWTPAGSGARKIFEADRARSPPPSDVNYGTSLIHFRTDGIHWTSWQSRHPKIECSYWSNWCI